MNAVFRSCLAIFRGSSIARLANLCAKCKPPPPMPGQGCLCGRHEAAASGVRGGGLPRFRARSGSAVISSAFLAWRASRHTIGRPSGVSTAQSQVVNGPVSRPMRTAVGAHRRTAAAMTTGSVAHRPRQTRSAIHPVRRTAPWLFPPDACVATIKLYPSRAKSSVIGSRDYRLFRHPRPEYGIAQNFHGWLDPANHRFTA